MTSTSEVEQLSAAGKWHGEFKRYFELFREAFDELHGAVVKQAGVPNVHIRRHHDYPIRFKLDSGFPSFHDSGFDRDSTPRHYVSLVRPRGLLGLVSGFAPPLTPLPKGADLASFLRTHKIGKRLNLGARWDGPVDTLVGDAVERYFHLYGLGSPIQAKRRDALIGRLLVGTTFRKLDLRLVVPITMTHFETDHFQLTDTTYITRIPKQLQLARARMGTLGSGAVRMVVGAATHAFVSTDWNLDVDNIDEIRRSLSQSSPNVVEAVDTFFSALRVATGISTGYAQVVWVPKRWALEYFCDLPPIYGAALRRYPSEYDNYGWVGQGDTVTVENLNEVRRIYRAALSNQTEAMSLALKRLSRCLTRTDAADAILDGAIGLELLLGDKENQALSYKLRLRAAALALLHADPAYPAADVVSQVKRLYAVRSEIVHGIKKKPSKKASEPVDTSYSTERLMASNLLRFVLNAILTNPQYQDPAKIDMGLLLRGDETLAVPIEPTHAAPDGEVENTIG